MSYYRKKDGKFGEKAEIAWTATLSRFGNVVHQPFGDFGPDIFFDGMGVACYIEVECKRAWAGNSPWPYPDLGIFKRRFENAKCYNLPSVFLCSSKDHSRAVLYPLANIPADEEFMPANGGDLGAWVPDIVEVTAEGFDVWKLVEVAKKESNE